MTAWSKDFSKAPTDAQFLVRLPNWDCPSVMRFATYNEWTGLVFVEELLSDAGGGIDLDDLDGAEWAPIPA